MIDRRIFCRHCEYQLTGLSTNVCPECGASFDAARRRSFSRFPRLRRWCRTITAAVVVPSLLYVISYCCVVQVQPRPPFGAKITIVSSSGQGIMRIELEPTYRIGGAVASIVYRPVHAVDRRLRPGTWSETLATARPVLWAGM